MGSGELRMGGRKGRRKRPFSPFAIPYSPFAILVGFDVSQRGTIMPTPYEQDLDRNAANFQPLTPLSFLARAALVYPDRTAVIHGARSWTYRQFYARARQLASALARRGIKRGDTVAVVLANTPAMLEAHYGVPWPARCSTPSTRGSTPPSSRFTLDHGEAKVLITDREFSKVVKDALDALQSQAAGDRL